MPGLEVLLKYFPIAGVIVAGFMGYSQITTQLENVIQLQASQYEQISHRLDRIDDRLNR